MFISQSRPTFHAQVIPSPTVANMDSSMIESGLNSLAAAASQQPRAVVHPVTPEASTPTPSNTLPGAVHAPRSAGNTVVTAQNVERSGQLCQRENADDLSQFEGVMTKEQIAEMKRKLDHLRQCRDAELKLKQVAAPATVAVVAQHHQSGGTMTQATAIRHVAKSVEPSQAQAAECLLSMGASQGGHLRTVVPQQQPGQKLAIIRHQMPQQVKQQSMVAQGMPGVQESEIRQREPAMKPTAEVAPLVSPTSSGHAVVPAISHQPTPVQGVLPPTSAPLQPTHTVVRPSTQLNSAAGVSHLQQRFAQATSPHGMSHTSPSVAPPLQTHPRTNPGIPHSQQHAAVVAGTVTREQVCPDENEDKVIRVRWSEENSTMGTNKRVVKLVVTGAMGQANTLLSSYANLQQEILRYMQKQRLTEATVRFSSGGRITIHTDTPGVPPLVVHTAPQVDRLLAAPTGSIQGLPPSTTQAVNTFGASRAGPESRVSPPYAVNLGQQPVRMAAAAGQVVLSQGADVPSVRCVQQRPVQTGINVQSPTSPSTKGLSQTPNRPTRKISETGVLSPRIPNQPPNVRGSTPGSVAASQGTMSQAAQIFATAMRQRAAAQAGGAMNRLSYRQVVQSALQQTVRQQAGPAVGPLEVQKIAPRGSAPQVAGSLGPLSTQALQAIPQTAISTPIASPHSGQVCHPTQGVPVASSVVKQSAKVINPSAIVSQVLARAAMNSHASANVPAPATPQGSQQQLANLQQNQQLVALQASQQHLASPQASQQQLGTPQASQHKLATQASQHQLATPQASQQQLATPQQQLRTPQASQQQVATLQGTQQLATQQTPVRFSGPIKVLSVDNPSQSGGPSTIPAAIVNANSPTTGTSGTLIEGQDYVISCPNGTRVIGTWDGKYFKVKNPVAGGSCKFFYFAKFCIFLFAVC